MNYEYLFLDQWIGPVTAARIRKLVLKGTLSPETNIREHDNPGSNTCELRNHHSGDFDGIHVEYEKLRVLRLLLDQMWASQRDALMSKVTGTKPEKILRKLRYRSGFQHYRKAEEECLQFWRKEEESILNKRIRIRSTGPSPYHCKGLEGKLNAKRESVNTWLIENNLWNKYGCYSFEDDYENETLYVGQTSGAEGDIFQNRIKAHFRDRRLFCRQCTSIKFWVLRNAGRGSPRDKALALERLLILRYEPKSNAQQGSRVSQVDDILYFLRGEIEELAKDYS